MTLSNDPITAANQGWVLKQTDPPLYLTAERDGDIVYRPWFALNSVGAVGVGIIEVMG